MPTMMRRWASWTMGRALRMSPVPHGLQESGKGRAHTARMREAAWLKRIHMGCAVVVPGAAVMLLSGPTRLWRVSTRSALIWSALTRSAGTWMMPVWAMSASPMTVRPATARSACLPCMTRTAGRHRLRLLFGHDVSFAPVASIIACRSALFKSCAFVVAAACMATRRNGCARR